MTAKDEEVTLESRIAKALREIAVERELNFSDIAELLTKAGDPIVANTVARYLRGERSAPISFIDSFCKVTGYTMEHVLREASALPKVDVSSVIDGDPELDLAWKEMLKVSYEAAVRDSSSRKLSLSRRLR